MPHLLMLLSQIDFINHKNIWRYFKNNSAYSLYRKIYGAIELWNSCNVLFTSSWVLCAHTRQTCLSNLLTDNEDDEDNDVIQWH